MHALARDRLQDLFPTTPEAFVRPEHAEEALVLAEQYDIPSVRPASHRPSPRIDRRSASLTAPQIRKPLYYSVATHPHDHPSQAPAHDASPNAPHPALTPALSTHCDALLERLVAHFTPILFTVATAGHMACTDVFAERWMPLVIQPALDENGLCRPLETLERIIATNWAAEGLCPDCVKDKTEEWRGEQRVVWERMDEWLR